MIPCHPQPLPAPGGPCGSRNTHHEGPAHAQPLDLTRREIRLLAAFVENALLDQRVLDLCGQVPATVPSGLPVLTFEGCGN